jgi:hypothetical protein
MKSPIRIATLNAISLRRSPDLPVHQVAKGLIQMRCDYRI